jgi:hypothetical protein
MLTILIRKWLRPQRLKLKGGLKMRKGWYRDSYRHSLASKGIKTSFKAKRHDFRLDLDEEKHMEEMTDDEFINAIKVGQILSDLNSLPDPYVISEVEELMHTTDPRRKKALVESIKASLAAKKRKK